MVQLQKINMIRSFAEILLRMHIFVLLCLALLPLVSCEKQISPEEGRADSIETTSNFSLEGTWSQSYERHGNIVKSMITFENSGRGNIWSFLVDANGLTEVYFFDYEMEGTQTITINYDKGGNDILQLSNLQANEAVIAVQGSSNWFVNGELVRDGE